MEDGQQFKGEKLMSNFEDVRIFMKTFGQMIKIKPQFPDEKTMRLRYELIKEELNELEEAMKTKNLKEIADALTDILYVTYGAGFAYGIDLDKCFKEVQRANMSKLGEDGKPIYNEKGKVMKGPNYLEPNLKQFVKWIKEK
jgi:predicted HAD superfamily Cof-like phosphohydrolase